MRSTFDRIRHALSFEILGILLITPLGAWVFGQDTHSVAAVAIVGATLATVWNYAYNLLFDKALMRLKGHTRKTPGLRVLHAVLFEAGLLAALLPFIAWYLGVSLATAFAMDAGFAGFYLVYAFVFNWAYDLIFPVPHPARQR
ncbi:PACE efflux transporter [Roseobacteraceae bacterium NS-SX3]